MWWETVLKNPWVQALGFLLGLALVGFIVYGLSFVLVPLVLAFLVAYVLDPVVDVFEARGISRTATIGAFGLLAVGILLAIPLYAIPSAIDEAGDLAQAAQRAAREDDTEQGAIGAWISEGIDSLPLEQFVDYMGWREEFQQFREENPQVDEMVDEAGPDDTESETPDDQVEEPSDTEEAAEEEGSETREGREQTREIEPAAIIGWKIAQYLQDNLREVLQAYAKPASRAGQQGAASLARLLSSLGSSIVGVFVFLGNLAVFSFVAGFLLKDYDRVVAVMKDLVPHRWREPVYRVVGEIDEQLRGFLLGQGTVCLILATLYFVGFWLAGVPFAFAIAVFGGFAALIPFFGPLLTVLPAAAFTLINYGIDWNLLYVLIVFLAVQLLEGNVVQPLVMGARVGLHPVWVILAVMVFGSLLGFGGLIVAVPLAAVLKVLVEEGVDYYRHSKLFEPPQPDEG